MARTLPTPTFEHPPDSEISHVRLGCPDEPTSDESEPALAFEDLAPAAPELREPPVDLAAFIGQRWGLTSEEAFTLLSSWVRNYQPSGDYSPAFAAERSA